MKRAVVSTAYDRILGFEYSKFGLKIHLVELGKTGFRGDSNTAVLMRN